MADDTGQLIALTAEIVAAHVSHNHIRVANVPELIQSVHGALSAAMSPTTEAPVKPVGAVSVRASVKRNQLISMIDGKPYKTLARHLSRHGYTPATYRDTFNLPPDYPMVTVDYAEKRRSLALESGLGRKRASRASEAELAVKGAEHDDNLSMASEASATDRRDTPPAPKLPLEAQPFDAEKRSDDAVAKSPKARRPRLKIRT